VQRALGQPHLDLRAADAARARARGTIGWRGPMHGGISPRRSSTKRIGPDNTIGFGFSFPLRIFDRNQGGDQPNPGEITRVDAVREATALQVLAALDTDRQAALIQRERVISLRDVYLPTRRPGPATPSSTHTAAAARACSTFSMLSEPIGDCPRPPAGAWRVSECPLSARG